MKKKIIFFLFILLFSTLYADFTMSFVGDILLSYKMEPYLSQQGPTYPFMNVTSVLRKSKIVNGNLESPIGLSGTPMQNKSFYFIAQPKTVEGLVYAGFNILNLANNHILDFGELAFYDTLNILKNTGIETVGAGSNFSQAAQLKIIQQDNLKLGFLSFCNVAPETFYATKKYPGIIKATANNVKTLVTKNAQKVDILITIFHWGKEYSDELIAKQRELAHLAIDSGANLVIGHHPHIIQPLEIYHKTLIAYSLGNFVFGTYGYPPKKTADKSMILNIKVDGKIKSAEIIPLNIFNYDVKFQPQIAQGKKAQEILQYYSKLSSPYGVQIKIKNNKGSIQLP